MRLISFLASVTRAARASCARQSLQISTTNIFLRMASTLPRTPVFDAIARHDPNSLAIIHSASDRSFCYGSLLHDVAAAKDNLTKLANGKSLRGERIAFLAENGYDYVGADTSFSSGIMVLTVGFSNLSFDPGAKCHCSPSCHYSSKLRIEIHP